MVVSRAGGVHARPAKLLLFLGDGVGTLSVLLLTRGTWGGTQCGGRFSLRLVASIKL